MADHIQQKLDALKGHFGVLNSNDDGETPKTYSPRMPPSSFPIPMPGRNRLAAKYGYIGRQCMKGGLKNQAAG
ncbi:hypothetical protein Lal_00013277 [Lupinus albus]|uniref:Uncharacterized protein n=1 Tax=Lupinus albus TaxID=3870 RepID=A0A6A4P3U8_LUPAL|nr:hypothetical protein Lalb_Chr18g0058761 [Lupinus albus]KAF1890682.1 hypothetical protein Lal_00013277 [Lupinus albus]